MKNKKANAIYQKGQNNLKIFKKLHTAGVKRMRKKICYMHEVAFADKTPFNPTKHYICVLCGLKIIKLEGIVIGDVIIKRLKEGKKNG